MRCTRCKWQQVVKRSTQYGKHTCMGNIARKMREGGDSNSPGTPTTEGFS